MDGGTNIAKKKHTQRRHVSTHRNPLKCDPPIGYPRGALHSHHCSDFVIDRLHASVQPKCGRYLFLALAEGDSRTPEGDFSRWMFADRERDLCKSGRESFGGRTTSSRLGFVDDISILLVRVHSQQVVESMVARWVHIGIER